jgi:hypothetical protein
MRLVVTNDTKKPISGIRLALKDATDVWRVAIAAEFVIAQEQDEWAAKFAPTESGPTILVLPLLRANKKFEIEVQGDVRSSVVDVTTSQALRSDVVPVLSIQDRGLVWLVTRVDKRPDWWRLISGLPLLGLIGTALRKRYDDALRAQLLKDVLPEHARYFARQLIAAGRTESATALLIGAVQNDGARNSEILKGWPG